MRELFAVVPLVAGFARIQLFMHVFQFENSGWPWLERMLAKLSQQKGTKQ